MPLRTISSKGLYTISASMLLTMLVFTLISIVSPGRAFAGFSDLPNCLPEDAPTSAGQPNRDCGSGGQNIYVHLSNSPNDDDGNGAIVESSYFKVYYNYKPTSTQRIYVDLTGTASQCSSYQIRGTWSALDQNENATGLPGSLTDDSDNCGQITYLIDPSFFNAASQVDGHEGLYVLSFSVSMVVAGGTCTTPHGPYCHTANLHVKTNSSGAKLGYERGRNVILYAPQSAGAGNTYQIEFAPRCSNFGSSNTLTKTVYWSDDDQGENPQNRGTTHTLVFNTKDITGGLVASDINYSGAGPGGSADLALEKYHSYRLYFDNVTGGNGINLVVPYDTADAELHCKPPQPPSTCLRYREFNTDSGNSYRVTVFPGQNAAVGATYSSGSNTYISRGGGLDPGETRSSRLWIDWSAKGPPPPSQSADYFTGNGGDHDTYYQNNLSSGHTVVAEEWAHDGSEWRYIRAQVYNRPPCNLTCNMNVIPEVVGATSPNAVRASQPYSVVVTITNNGTDSIPTTHPVFGNRITATGDYGVHYTVANSGIDPGQTIQAGSFTLNAQGAIGSYPLGNMYPDYYGLSAMGPICSNSISVYQPFELTPTPVLDLINESGAVTDSESPTAARYQTYVDNNASFAVSCNVTTSRSYENPDSGGQITKAGPSGYAGDCGPARTNTFGAGTYPIPTLTAGDQYCTEITVPYTNGWRGPSSSGDVAETNGAQNVKDCDKVVNKPYFKTYGGGVSAGGGFAGVGTGEIVAWTNNVDGTYPFGAGAQLAALANGEITGFASAQGVPAGSTAYLSFANSGGVAVNSGDYSPKLGGNFKASHPSTQLTPKNPTVLAGGSTYGGVTISGNRSVEVAGDVYIDNNITYSGGSWSDTDLAKTVPSFVLVATGNIYIAPNVTRLDGIYTSQKVNGAIYTCSKITGASSFAPRSPSVAADNFFSACKNQLLVHGSFVADKVNLMRTYGSLRDEKPTPTTTPTPKRYTPRTNYCFGENDALTNANCRAAGYTNCIRIDEGYNLGYPFPWWSDNWLCNKPADGVSMQWTSAGAALGLPRCANWSPNGHDNSGWAWSDNRLCTSGSKNISFQRINQTSTPNAYNEYERYCTKLFDASDPNTNGGNATNNIGGAWLCEDQIMTDPGSDGSPRANVAVPCSNSAGAIVVDLRTCAAEIFDFSPDIYISNPDVELSPRSKLRWDAITSLPPIL